MGNLFTASPSLTRAVEIALEYLGVKGKRRVTREVVDAVDATGTMEVRGVPLRTSGDARGMVAGEREEVLWSRDRSVRGVAPVAVLKHQINQGAPTEALLQSSDGDIVEELFIGTDGGRLDVWFRDHKYCASLKLRQNGLTADPKFVRWGVRENSFFVITADAKFWVFAFGRTANDKAVRSFPAPRLVRTETPFDGTLALCEVNCTATGAGTNWTIDFVDAAECQFIEDADTVVDVSTIAMVERSLSVATARSGPVVLTVASLLGTAEPLTAPSVVIADAQLDDNMELVLALNVDPLVLAGSSREGSDPVPSYDGSTYDGSFTEFWTYIDDATCGDGVFIQTGMIPYCSEADRGYQPTPRGVGRQLFLLNTTRRTLLYSSCVNPVTRAATYSLSRFRFAATSPGIEMLRDGCDDVAANSALPLLLAENGTALTVNESFTPDDDTEVVECALGLFGKSATDLLEGSLTSLTAAYVEPALLTAIGADAALETVASGSVDVTKGVSCANGGFGNLGRTFAVHVTGTWVEKAESKSWSISGQYVPARRPNKATAAPLGKLVIKVREQPRVGDPRWGLFLKDLVTGAVTTLLPMVTNAHASQGVNLNPPGVTFQSLLPETDQVFVTLGAGPDHLYYLHKQQTSPTTVPTDVSVMVISSRGRSPVGTKRAALTAEGMAAGQGTTPSNPGLAAALKTHLARALALCRPDFLFSGQRRTVSAQGERFYVGWNMSTNAPSLADPPVADSRLAQLGALKKVPAATSPQAAATVSNDAGPVNVIYPPANGGPSFHVVNDSAALVKRGRYESDK